MTAKYPTRRAALAGLGLSAAAPRAMAAQARPSKVLTIRFAANQATIPITLANRMTLAFLVDSGAVHVGMSAPELSATGLKPACVERVSGAAGEIASIVYDAPVARVGESLLLHDLLIRSLDLGPLADMDRPVGLLPLSVLGASKLDVVSRTLTLFETHKPPASAATFPGADPLILHHGRGLTSRIFDPRPYGTVTLLGRTLKVMLDTGYNGALILTSKYVRDSGLSSRFDHGASRTLAGATGSVVASMIPIDSLGFAGQMFGRTWIELNDPEANIPGDVDYQGVVGMEILRRFDLWADGHTGAVALSPNAWIDDVERYDRSGLDLSMPASGGPGLVVTAVSPTSPADQAGFKSGDIVLGYSGMPGLDDLRWTLSGAPGTTVRLRRLRDDAEQPATLVLQEPP